MKKGIIADEISSDLETSFRKMRERGYAYAELHNVFAKSIETLDAAEVREVKRLLQKYDLKVSNISSTIFFLCPLYDTDEVSLFNDAFCAVRGDLDTHLSWLENACRIAGELGCGYIRLFPFRFPDNRKGPYGTEADMERIVSAMKRASDIAEAFPVTLVVENCPYSHLPKGQMTLEMVRRVNRDNVRLLYDPANSYRAVRENVPEAYLGWTLQKEARELAAEVRHMHVKDYHYDPAVQPKPFLHVPSGSGDLPYEEIFRIFDDSGFSGVCSLEPEAGEEGALLSMDWMNGLTAFF